MSAAGRELPTPGPRMLRLPGLTVWRIRSGAGPARVEPALPTGRGVFWWEWVGQDAGYLLPLWRALGLDAQRIAELLSDRWDDCADGPCRWLCWPMTATLDRVRIFCAPGMVLTATSRPELLGGWRQRLLRPLPRWAAGSDGVVCLLIAELMSESSASVEDLARRSRWLEERRAGTLGSQELEAVVVLNQEILTVGRRLGEQRSLVGHLASRPQGSVPEERQRTLERMFRRMDLLASRLAAVRELVRGSLDAQLSLLSCRTNEVMRTLTIIATLMMPATLVTGIYGMNFHIPETQWAYGYFFALGLMTAISTGMLVHFRHRGWL